MDMGTITTSLDAYSQLKSCFSKDVEEFWSIALSSNKKTLARCCLFRGTVDQCMVHPRDIFRFAITNNSSSLLIAHNHPSGNPEPSPQDIQFTRQIIQASQLVEIPIVDHIIFGNGDYWSFADHGWKFGAEFFK